MPHSRDQQRRDDRLFSKHYAHGFAYPRPKTGDERKAYVQLPNGRRIALHMRWSDENRKKIQERLERELDLFYDPPDERPAAAVRTMGALVKEYKDVVLASRDVATRKVHLRARKHYLSNDLPLDVATLREHVKTVDARIEAEGTLKPLTRRNYLSAIKGLFRYAVECGYLKRNPLLGYRIPGVAERTKISRFTDREVKRLLAWFSRKSLTKTQMPAAEWWMVFRLQSLTGLRIHEVLSLRRDQVKPGHSFTVKRKKSRKQKKPLWQRFPLIVPPELELLAAAGDEIAIARVRWVREIDGLLRELVARPPRVDGRLFEVCSIRSARDVLTQAKRELGLPEDKRATHSFRKYAIWYWRLTLKLDLSTCADLASHSEDIQELYYLEEKSPEELARELWLSQNWATGPKFGLGTLEREGLKNGAGALESRN